MKETIISFVEHIDEVKDASIIRSLYYIVLVFKKGN